ncbi:MAG: M23 family metallopeptidase [Spirochaetaceae bacterium]|nr:M23 family metallopeptidase [Spirochaetaceae bacterium]
MYKKAFAIVAMCLFTVMVAFSQENATAVFTGEDYSVYVTYTASLCPGDAICVSMDFTPSRQTMKEPTAKTQAVLLFGQERKSDFFVLKETKRQNGNGEVTLLGMIPVSTWQESGKYDLTVMYSPYGREFMKFTLPVNIKPKDFVSETIHLNPSNTAIKTDTSPSRIKQIDRLNDILYTINSESVYQQKAFTPPTDATRRTSFFGDRRVYAYSNGGSSTSLHYGIDYGVPTGTPVYSCGAGKVVLAENRVSTGWSVVIEHMPGLYSLYYHLDSYSVEEGQILKQGQQIGVSGATGLATGPHLHWEIRLNGEAVSPDYFTDGFAFFK